MTDKHDFKGAQVWFEHHTKKGELRKELDTALYALRLAHRLQSGEISKDMRYAGNKQKPPGPIGLYWCEVIFKAMAEQLLKEVQND